MNYKWSDYKCSLNKYECFVLMFCVVKHNSPCSPSPPVSLQPAAGEQVEKWSYHHSTISNYPQTVERISWALAACTKVYYERHRILFKASHMLNLRLLTSGICVGSRTCKACTRSTFSDNLIKLLQDRFRGSCEEINTALELTDLRPVKLKTPME